MQAKGTTIKARDLIIALKELMSIESSVQTVLFGTGKFSEENLSKS